MLWARSRFLWVKARKSFGSTFTGLYLLSKEIRQIWSRKSKKGPKSGANESKRDVKTCETRDSPSSTRASTSAAKPLAEDQAEGSVKALWTRTKARAEATTVETGMAPLTLGLPKNRYLPMARGKMLCLTS